MLAAQSFVDPWRFEANVEVYLLVGFLVGAYIYMVRVIGPRAVPPGTPVVTRRHIGCFVIAMLVLFFASTWPIHQIGEEYLYSVHMVQHMMLSYFLPPLVWLATPEWLLRVLVGRGRLYRVVTFMAKPVVAAVVFNLMVMVLHIPGVVNTAPTSAPLHYLLHLAVVRLREAAAVLHTHSVWSNILSDAFAADGGLRIEGYEMLKGLEGISSHEHLEWLPIIENSQDMIGLALAVEEALKQHPSSHGFLLRRHGL